MFGYVAGNAPVLVVAPEVTARYWKKAPLTLGVAKVPA